PRSTSRVAAGYLPKHSCSDFWLALCLCLGLDLSGRRFSGDHGHHNPLSFHRGRYLGRPAPTWPPKDIAAHGRGRLRHFSAPPFCKSEGARQHYRDVDLDLHTQHGWLSLLGLSRVLLPAEGS